MSTDGTAPLPDDPPPLPTGTPTPTSTTPTSTGVVSTIGEAIDSRLGAAANLQAARDAAFSPDGKSVYVADGSATGFHVLTPADPSTPLQTTPPPVTGP